MSECVVRMEMPGNCECCPMCFTADVQGYHWCAALEQEVERGLSRPKECPIICQLPEGHGRLVDADELKAKQQEDADLFINAYTLMEKSRRDEALNAVANIVNATTIVPAEAERSET